MTAPTITRLPRAEPKQTQAPRLERLLWCETCGPWTRHALSKDGTFYACSCGGMIIYLRNLNPKILD